MIINQQGFGCYSCAKNLNRCSAIFINNTFLRIYNHLSNHRLIGDVLPPKKTREISPANLHVDDILSFVAKIPTFMVLNPNVMQKSLIICCVPGRACATTTFSFTSSLVLGTAERISVGADNLNWLNVRNRIGNAVPRFLHPWLF